MTWLHVPPLPESACAPESECSTSELSSPPSSWAGRIARSCTWRGKRFQPRTWRKRWKTACWVRRLSGLISGQSEARSAAVRYGRHLATIRPASCTVGSPVSPGRLRVGERELRTPGTFGPQQLGLFGGTAPELSTSRTSQTCSVPREVPTASSETWRAWATRLRRRCSRLERWARVINASVSGSWASWAGLTVAMAQQVGYTRDGGEPGKERLAVAGQGRRGFSSRQHSCVFRDARNWPTAVVGNAHEWRENRTGLSLAGAAPLWPATPQPETTGPPGSLLLALARISYPPEDQRRLSPRFAEWLMGWPPGWTASALSVTEWIRWRRQSLSWISMLRSLHAGRVTKVWNYDSRPRGSLEVHGIPPDDPPE